jgi:hypothetical protein
MWEDWGQREYIFLWEVEKKMKAIRLGKTPKIE